jgi:phosphoglycolate phosphatase
MKTTSELAEFPFRTILFDLDGTLIDSIGDVVAAVNKVLATRGLAPVEGDDRHALLGEGTAARIARAFAMRGVTLEDAEARECIEEFNRHYRANAVVTTTVYPGVAATLRKLSSLGVRIGVCTNKDEQSARDILRRLGLMPPIDDVAGADTFGVRKPHPAHLLKLLERMNADRESALMVGDSIHDLEAAHAAGLPMLAVSWGYTSDPKSLSGAHGLIDRFEDLVDRAAALKERRQT